jgi:hypothetical protein
MQSTAHERQFSPSSHIPFPQSSVTLNGDRNGSLISPNSVGANVGALTMDVGEYVNSLSTDVADGRRKAAIKAMCRYFIAD